MSGFGLETNVQGDLALVACKAQQPLLTAGKFSVDFASSGL